MATSGEKPATGGWGRDGVSAAMRMSCDGRGDLAEGVTAVIFKPLASRMPGFCGTIGVAAAHSPIFTDNAITPVRIKSRLAIARPS
jgi:hypothetical protein